MSEQRNEAKSAEEIARDIQNEYAAKVARVVAVTESGTDKLVSRGLPKWPQMYTTGKPVTPEQAKEIIRRTDTFFRHGYGGNDRAFNERLARRVGMPSTEGVLDPPAGWWQEHWRKLEEWRRKWGVIETEYVKNSWISCAYIFGPHGWCHPSGKIGYVDNIGKWPDVVDVVAEWMTLAEAFPFVELAATLMNGEQCEDGIEPVVTILVKHGKVRLVAGDLRHHKTHEPSARRSFDDIDALRLGTFAREHGPIPENWYTEWAIIGRRIAQGM